MKDVMFNYVVDGVVKDGPFDYDEVVQRTGLRDTVGYAEHGYVEIMESVPAAGITQEQIYTALRNKRNYLLELSDWTQLSDLGLSTEQKTLWTNYRQTLRDIPTTYSNILDLRSLNAINWPQEPA